jgi:uncharacterized protein YbgA (DUF1722 family)/uncharacterized protein YbbK (DUF523 family)
VRNPNHTATGKILIGISSCLLGENVRYNGGHKLDRYLRDTLGQYVEYVPVCPEAECGLGIPREAMHLEGDPGAPRLVTSNTGRDLTEQMIRYSKNRVRELETVPLCGFIFKSNSPSSGMERVKIYDHNHIPRKTGTGIFAGIFMKHFPLLPVEDDGRLHDPKIRENFITRIFVFKRFREMIETEITIAKLVEFHSSHKLLIMAHSQNHYRAMGKLVAHAKEMTGDELCSHYQSLLMEGLSLKTTIKKNTNVLHHLMGYFKKQLSADEKQELLEIIENYHQGNVPLIVPVTLINHYVRKYDQPYLKEQHYLHPHPVELQLLNHV